MRSCDDGYPTCRKAEATGEWCKAECESAAKRPADAAAASPLSSDTPETDTLHAEHAGAFIWPEFARRLERERDEARELCRWSFPRLRAICHDFDAESTGWACAREMQNHPEIFSERNASVEQPGPTNNP